VITFLRAANSPRPGRAVEIAHALGAECVLTSNPATVTWLTGYSAATDAWPDPYALAPLALVTPGEPPVLVVARERTADVEALGCRAVPAGGFTIGPVISVPETAAVVDRLVGRRRVATEPAHLPAALAGTLDAVDATDALAHARAVKDEDEIELVRELIRLCDAGQDAVRRGLAAGVDELDLWAAAQRAMEHRAGSRLTVVADVISGPRSAQVSGDPTRREIAPADAVVCDLLPRCCGYWGDSTSTLALEPSAEIVAAWTLVHDVLGRLLDAVRPGVIAGELDAFVRSRLEHPHHTGHGVGTSYHEEPRLVPGNETVLAPGMVVALEPAVYRETFGVRLEIVVLVTPDGAEVLSGHSLEL
jgi:Xaa-Pro aminopeptidase